MNYSEKLEKRIIGNLLLDDSLDANRISAEYFYFQEIREIYEEIVKCKKDNEPLEIVFLRKENYSDLLSNCTSEGVVTTNYEHNCKNLIKLYVARKVTESSEQMSNVTYKEVEKDITELQEYLESLSELFNADDLKIIDPSKVELKVNTRVTGYVPTGFESIDNCLNDLEPKRTTLITGPSFAGKTTFVRQVIANAIDTNNKVLWIMGENEVNDELRRLYEIVIGRKKGSFEIIKENKRYIKLPKKEMLAALKKWQSGRLRILHKTEAKVKSHTEMFELLEKELKSKKHNLIVVDNLMSVLSAKSFEKNEAQSDFMQACCDLAKVYDTHIALVLHPRKGVDTTKCENDDISGTLDIPNKADNIIWVLKSNEDQKLDGIDGFVKITKNKKWGETVTIKTYFDKETNSLSEIKDGKSKVNKFDIERYLDTTIVYNDGTTQTFEQGEFDPF